VLSRQTQARRRPIDLELTPLLSITWGEWRAVVAPGIGGSVVSLSLGEHAILRPTPADALAAGDVRRTACYPLVPYANRIAHGRFLFAGATYALRENFPGSVHPLHGVCWRRPWQVTSADTRSCELMFQHEPAGEKMLDWPFAFDAHQRFALGPEGLIVSLALTNTSSADAPVGLGLHPLFSRRTAETLAFNAEGAWRNGPDLLPAERVRGGDWDHGAGRAVGAADLDNDFFGWDGRVSMTAQGLKVLVSASSVFSALRVFTPSGRDFFAVEPVSHSADAINRGGLAVLAPGASLAGTMTIGAEVTP
jgi:aldose 1-epimerase